MNSKVYKWCAVPLCKNTSIATPNKLFVFVPNKKLMRDKWLTLARRNPRDVVTNSSIYFCEDHFDLPNDMENYMQYHLMGSVSQVRMKPGCIPKKFVCQSDRKSRTCDTIERPYIRKKRKMMALDECENQLEDAWDDDGDTPKRKLTIKQEPCETTTTPLPTPNLIKKIKCEPEDKDDIFEERPYFKCDVSIKKEKKCESFEEGELEDTICEPISDSDKLVHHLTKQELKRETSPVPIKLKFDSDGPVDRMFDESPYNNKLLESWKIKDRTPVKTETEGPSSKCSLKSAKRTVFNRRSPYKKTEYDTPEKRISAKSRLGTIVDSDEEGGHPAKRAKIRPKKDMESNPEVLTRREKQIEYGKNTIGYENYLQMVPRGERKKDDPKTPPKYGKYSRRGWEGLIKQWRIKLHKYDPPEDNP